jgi:hypothetical protein
VWWRARGRFVGELEYFHVAALPSFHVAHNLAGGGGLDFFPSRFHVVHVAVAVGRTVRDSSHEGIQIK